MLGRNGRFPTCFLSKGFPLRVEETKMPRRLFARTGPFRRFGLRSIPRPLALRLEQLEDRRLLSVTLGIHFNGLGFQEHAGLYAA